MIVASMSTITQLCSRFPATVSQGNPPGRKVSQDQTTRRTFALARAIAASRPASKSSNVRCTVESETLGPVNRW